MERKINKLENLNSINYRLYLDSKSGPIIPTKERNIRTKDTNKLKKEKKTAPKTNKNRHKMSIQKYKLR